MRVGIVGGGTSGVVAAWLLDPATEITLYEAAPTLGGHVRTLNRNVPCDALPAGVTLDCGVLEFDRQLFPVFHRLMAALRVPTVELDGGETGLFLSDHRYLTPQKILRECGISPSALTEMAHLVPLALRRLRFAFDADHTDPQRLLRLPIGDFLGDGDFGVWCRALLMYAYSTPFADCGDLPASLAVPVLRRFLFARQWTSIPTGAATYIDAMANDLRGEVRVASPVHTVRRGPAAVEVVTDEGADRFDAVVFATPPGDVLRLLHAPTPDEIGRLGAWHTDEVTTLVHTDPGLYERRGVHYWSEFDLFAQPHGDYGYNAFLDRVCCVPAGLPDHYHLAFHLEDEIDDAAVIHRQAHRVPRYTVEACRWRPAVEAAQGANRTWLVGAWLGDGLQEGAVTSALRVAEGLGGDPERIRQLRKASPDSAS